MRGRLRAASCIARHGRPTVPTALRRQQAFQRRPGHKPGLAMSNLDSLRARSLTVVVDESYTHLNSLASNKLTKEKRCNIYAVRQAWHG